MADPPTPVSRRDFVKAAVITASAAALGTGALSGILPILSGRDTDGVRSPILRGNGEGATDAMTLRDLDGPAVVVAAGQWTSLPAIVFKVRTSTLQASAAARGYNTGQYALQHPDDADHAVLAYDAKCTHLGCTVEFNAQLGESKDIPDYENDGVAGRILCPCHQSQFDVFDLGRNLPGMPAQRPLGVLAIAFGPEVDGSPTLEAFRRIPQGRYRAADRDGDGASFQLAG